MLLVFRNPGIYEFSEIDWYYYDTVISSLISKKKGNVIHELNRLKY